MLPGFLRNFNVEVNGSSHKMAAEEITLPKIVYKTEEWEGAGMIAPMEVKVGLEKLEATIKIIGIPEDIYMSFGLSVGGFSTVLATGSVEVQGVRKDPVKAILQGWIKELDPGIWKAGDVKSATTTIILAINRYHLFRNNIPLVNIDIPNGIEFVGGIDQNAIDRANLLI